MRQDYTEVYANFDVNAATREILGAGNAALNAAVLCCDRHCSKGRIALNAVARDGRNRRYSFDELKDQSERFAQVLRDHGVKAGDVVAVLLPRIPELLVTALAVWRLGAIYQPLFTAFGPKAIEHRVVTSAARVIVSDTANRSKLADIGTSARIVTVAKEGETPPGDLDFRAEIAGANTGIAPVPRSLDDPFLIVFTSGTTGPAKPLFVPLRAIVAYAVYVREAVGLIPEDRFWNFADPGWAYGLYYAVIAPLALGHETLLYDGPFDVASTVTIIRDYGITNLAGAPTAFRLLMAAGPQAVAPIKGQLRAISSAGEPLNPEVIHWFKKHLSAVIYDHYGQTEMGMVLCNHHALAHPVLPGSAGFSLPGFRMVVLDDEGRELTAGQPGELAVDLSHSPLFAFTGYLSIATPALGPRYYRTGDTAMKGDHGSVTFIGRADDVITSAGYRIGPFDVESALVEHPAVVEAAAVGKPDAERTEIVKAFIVLKQDIDGTPALAEELAQHVKRRLSAHAYPREIEFVSALPKTPSGKIQRFVLRSQEIEKAQAR